MFETACKIKTFFRTKAHPVRTGQNILDSNPKIVK